MSGGVDSSVAGYLLSQQGYEVIGVTMKVWPQDCISRAEDKCCGPQAVADARGAAHSLGIPHYVVDEADQFERLVIDYFSSEYQAGRTPNPCVMCNEKLKFGNLWSKAAALGCDYIATGHYAIIEQRADHAILRKGLDPRKDQSYFLFSLRQPQLRRALTPLGKMTKPQIREIACSLGLKVADKADSQEICFVPGNDYKAFLRSHLGENEFHRGEIYDVAGNFLGEHDGIELFTIGQRRGLPGGSPRPRYVVDMDPATNRVIVGDADDLVTDEFEIDRVNWICDIARGFHGGSASCEPSVAGAPPSRQFDVTVKIRYSHPGTRATLTQLDDGRAHVRLHDRQRAVTPGQAAVLYDDDIVLGGGWICRGEPPGHSEPIGRSETFNRSSTPALA
ncbi:MAG: tRNA 2-thiouridine(34) synthase MnmA [Verrucomicrobia bacterium]|nr:MAG: tRNA 2-thiouridine(34) synthase MnmA [Verrucomicrobiota bacterium]PYL33718.1 MAG: tRNA 2-thiouridine(34) synthase MnmA [Verrucomicrobiota bacterium]